jgi:hypothetical protein
MSIGSMAEIVSSRSGDFVPRAALAGFLESLCAIVTTQIIAENRPFLIEEPGNSGQFFGQISGQFCDPARRPPVGEAEVVRGIEQATQVGRVSCRA